VILKRVTVVPIPLKIVPLAPRSSTGTYFIPRRSRTCAAGGEQQGREDEEEEEEEEGEEGGC